MPVTPALERLRQKDPKFKVSLGYIAKKQTNKQQMQMLHLI
jgi:hypothetical protein